MGPQSSRANEVSDSQLVLVMARFANPRHIPAPKVLSCVGHTECWCLSPSAAYTAGELVWNDRPPLCARQGKNLYIIKSSRARRVVLENARKSGALQIPCLPRTQLTHCLILTL